jgi:hypothetical protein
MSKAYLVDEFIGTTEQFTFEDQVDKKVSLLYDLCKLQMRGRKSDDREDAVKHLLASYQSEVLMDNAIHDVVVGKYTLNDLLKRKGYLQ